MSTGEEKVVIVFESMVIITVNPNEKLMNMESITRGHILGIRAQPMIVRETLREGMIGVIITLCQRILREVRRSQMV